MRSPRTAADAFFQTDVIDGYTPGTTILGRRKHVVGKEVDPRQGFIAEVNSERWMR
ncbi:MAG: hypothetical protein QNJ87_16370 [Gammaproteobacteria bacterium]|nr:hypothetical protein [Gammaproteobacteria bacterium]MDJ0873328.1 hypothetical protein [Gammaproteobacteria bacterium]